MLPGRTTSISRRALFSKLNRTLFRAVESAAVTPALLGRASGPVAAHASAVQSALTRYCTDLTQRARAGEIDPVIGRVHEIRTLVDILLRRRRNNPLLTGETGVGKTCRGGRPGAGHYQRRRARAAA